MWKVQVFNLILCLVLLALVLNSVEGKGRPKERRKKPKQNPLQQYTNRDDVYCYGSYLCGTKGYGKDLLEDCIHTSRVCDGVVDCESGIDEDDCAPRCAVSGLMLCHNRRRCAKFCDGVAECPESEDEINCPGQCACGDGTFTCDDDSAICLPVLSRCNGVIDCEGPEDEEGCGTCCPDGTITCLDGVTCIDIAQRCDGVFDCPKHEDEKLCPPVCSQCSEGQYFCDKLPGMEQVCVDAAETCETSGLFPHLDCPLGDDELAQGGWCGF